MTARIKQKPIPEFGIDPKRPGLPYKGQDLTWLDVTEKEVEKAFKAYPKRQEEFKEEKYFIADSAGKKYPVRAIMILAFTEAGHDFDYPEVTTYQSAKHAFRLGFLVGVF